MSALRFPRAAGGWLGLALLLYLGLRLAALAQVEVLEDRDSASLIRDAQGFAGWDLADIVALRPDATPVQPLGTALLGELGLPLPTAARALAFLSALLLLGALVALAWLIARQASPFDRLALAAGTVLAAALSPTLVELSRAVLTEGPYVALVTLGLAMLLWPGDRWSARRAAALGLVFGLAFLARTEGLVYIAVLPGLMLVQVIRERWLGAAADSGRPGWRRLPRWVVAYGASFALLALPQVWRVSHVMGQPAVNGRQVWQVILNQPDEQPYERRIYGLDHSPSVINLFYIQSHPELARQMATRMVASDVLGKALEHVRRFFLEVLPRLLGPLGLLLMVLGLPLLWRLARGDALLALGFGAASLAAPLAHDLDPRHLAVSLPLLALCQGAGWAWLLGRVRGDGADPGPGGPDRRRLVGAVLALLLALGLSAGLRADLAAALRPDPAEQDYSWADQEQLLAALAAAGWPAPAPELRLVARQGFLSLDAGGQEVHLPFTDYPGLLRYCRLHRAQVLFLEHAMLAKYPFLARFQAGDTPEFRRFLRYQSPSHGLMELYHITPGEAEP